MDIASDGSRHFGVHFVHLTCTEDASSICKNRPVPARVRLPVSVGFSAECERDVRFGSKADICSALTHVRFVPIADIGVVNSVLGSAIVRIVSTVASRADNSDMKLIERVKI